MRSNRPLIIIPLSLLLVILMVVSSFIAPKTTIVGAWVSKENPANKIEFLQNGIAKSYTANTSSKPYHYSVSAQCDRHDSTSLCIKITDDNTNASKCYKLKDVEEYDEDVLVLTDSDSSEEYFFEKVY